MNVSVLGCGSALPTMHHNNAAQVVETEGHLYLIDCGEGTQVWLRRSKKNFSRIAAVFITHLHGDHVLGLMGVILSFNLLGRRKPLEIFAPKELEPLLDLQMKMFCRDMGYEVVFHAVDTTKNEQIFEDKKVTVRTLPLSHKMPCAGFLFTEKKTQRAYAYCSDTKYLPNLHEQLKGVNVLYHEATYAQDKADGAAKYFHSTAQEAAMVARDAKVEKLYIGHYSQRYRDENILLNEAREVYPKTYLTDEKMCFDI